MISLIKPIEATTNIKRDKKQTEKQLEAYRKQVKTFSGMSIVNKRYYDSFSLACKNFTQYKPDVGVLCEAFDDITSLSPADVEDYLGSNEVKSTTLANKKAHIRSFLQYIAKNHTEARNSMSKDLLVYIFS